MAKRNTKLKSAQVRMEQELYDKAVSAADNLGLSFSGYVRMLISKEIK